MHRCAGTWRRFWIASWLTLLCAGVAFGADAEGDGGSTGEAGTSELTLLPSVAEAEAEKDKLCRIVLNTDRIAPGDTLTVDVVYNDTIPRGMYGVWEYVVLVAPGVGMLYWGEGGGIHMFGAGGPAPRTRHLLLTPRLRRVGTLPWPASVPPGEYAFYVIATLPGGNPLDAAQWVAWDETKLTALAAPAADYTPPVTTPENVFVIRSEDLWIDPSKPDYPAYYMDDEYASFHYNWVNLKLPVQLFEKGDRVVGPPEAPFLGEVTYIAGRGAYTTDPASGERIYEATQLTWKYVSVGSMLQTGAFDFNNAAATWETPYVVTNAREEARRRARGLPDYTIGANGEVTFGEFVLLRIPIEDGELKTDKMIVFGEERSAARRAGDVKPGFSGAAKVEAVVKRMRFRFTPDVEGDLKMQTNMIGLPSEIESMRMRVRGTVSFDVELELRAETEFSFNEKRALMPTVRWPFVVPVGGVPVYMALEMDLAANFSMNGKAEGVIKMGFDSSYRIDALMDYDGTSWTARVTDTADFSPNHSMEVAANLSAGLSIDPQIAIKLYGIMGPRITMGPYVSGAIETNWGKPGGIGASLHAGVAGRMDFQISALWGPPLQSRGFDLFDIQKTLWEWSVPNERPYTVASPSGSGGYVGFSSTGTWGATLCEYAEPVAISLTAREKDAEGSGDADASTFYYFEYPDGTLGHTENMEYIGPFTLDRTARVHYWSKDFLDVEDEHHRLSHYFIGLKGVWSVRSVESTLEETRVPEEGYEGLYSPYTRDASAPHRTEWTITGSDASLTVGGWSGSRSGASVELSGKLLSESEGYYPGNYVYPTNEVTLSGSLEGNVLTLTGSGRAVVENYAADGETLRYTTTTEGTLTYRLVRAEWYRQKEAE